MNMAGTVTFLSTMQLDQQLPAVPSHLVILSTGSPVWQLQHYLEPAINANSKVLPAESEQVKGRGQTVCASRRPQKLLMPLKLTTTA